MSIAAISPCIIVSCASADVDTGVSKLVMCSVVVSVFFSTRYTPPVAPESAGRAHASSTCTGPAGAVGAHAAATTTRIAEHNTTRPRDITETASNPPSSLPTRCQTDIARPASPSHQPKTPARSDSQNIRLVQFRLRDMPPRQTRL